jgi:hypothetical protein
VLYLEARLEVTLPAFVYLERAGKQRLWLAACTCEAARIDLGRCVRRYLERSLWPTENRRVFGMGIPVLTTYYCAMARSGWLRKSQWGSHIVVIAVVRTLPISPENQSFQ